MVGVVWLAKLALGTTLDDHELLAVSILIGAPTYAICLRILAPGRIGQALEYIRLAMRPGRAQAQE
jgi:hypothetical protein